MGLVKENSRSRNWTSAPIFRRAIKDFDGKSILHTTSAEVRINNISGRESSFIALGKLHTSADESDESILRRIVHMLVSARKEQSGDRIVRAGKEPPMDQAISYDRDNLPTLSEESRLHLNAIKHRAAIRRAKRLTSPHDEGREDLPGNPAGMKAVSVSSRKGKLISST